MVNNSVSYQGNTLTVQQRTIGNVNLRPEIARNSVFGIVLAQPTWAPGLSASIDYFDIKVRDVISSLSIQQEVDLCTAGNKEICGAMDLTSATKYVTAQAFNLASMRDKGFDVEAVYRMGLADLGLPGHLTWRALGSRTLSFLTDSGVLGTIPSEGAGVNMGNTPKWKVLASQGWDNDKASVTLSERWISDGVYSNEFIECQTGCPVSTVVHPTIFDNRMKGAFYVDIGATYKFSNKLTGYAKIDNVANVDPVDAPQSGPGFGINPALYDVLGRQYRAGLRYNF